MVLMTRQEVIDTWVKQNENQRHSFVCPNCRNIMYFDPVDRAYACLNMQCLMNEKIPESEVERI